VPCRINMFSGRIRERSPRENPSNGDFGGFSHGDLSPRQAKIRKTVAENAMHGMSRTFVLRGDRSPCENPTKSPFRGFSHGDLSPRQANIRQTGGEKATHEKCRTFVWRGERSPCENTNKSPFGGFSRCAFFCPENTIIRHGTNQPPYILVMYAKLNNNTQL